MKRLFITILILLPLFCISQKSVIVSTSGDTIVNVIRYSTGKMIFFNDKIGSLNSDKIPWTNVTAVLGNLDKVRVKVVSKDYPNIYFNPDYKVRFDPSNFSPSNLIIYEPSSGDLIKRSGVFKLSSLGVGILTTAYLGFSRNGLESEEAAAVTTIGSALTLSLYVFGEISLIRAGNKMNKEALSLGLAENGIGLAIRF